jgi:hypothetical protein
VIFGHFGLALSGLVIWGVYLVTGWAALAWTAVRVLLPKAGLGMATLSIGLPEYRTSAVMGRNATAAADPSTAVVAGSDDSAAGADDTGADGTIRVDAGLGGAQAIRIGAGSAQAISRGRDTSQPATVGARTPTVSVRARPSPLVVAGHGLLAVTTMLLVLLAALGAAAN